MIKEMLSHIQGIEYYGTFFLLLFFLLFCAVIIKVWKLDPKTIQRAERLPLEDTENQGDHHG